VTLEETEECGQVGENAFVLESDQRAYEVAVNEDEFWQEGESETSLVVAGTHDVWENAGGIYAG